MTHKQILFPLLLAAALTGLVKDAYSQTTDGKVTFSVQTAAYSASYNPKHVSAVWVVDGNGKFVKTLCRHASARIGYLYRWIADRGTYTTVDGVTSATLSTQPQTHTMTWDCRNAAGQVVPDGAYFFRAEYTSNNGQGPYMASNCQFMKGTIPVTATFPNISNAGGQFSGMSLKYTPYAETAVTSLAPNSGVINSHVAVLVTVANQTSNPLSFHVAVSNLTSGTLIGTQPVTALAGQAVTNLTFDWSTAGLAAAPYQISAIASKLSAETNTANNVMTGTISLSSPTAGDIGVTGLTPSTGIINSTVPVRVTVTNKMAGATGPFTVSLSAVGAVQQIASLAAFAVTNLTFSWNTAGVTAGVYQVRAQAGPLATEAFTADNTLAGAITLRGAFRDLAVSAPNVAPVVPPNLSATVRVAVTNRGDVSETFTATLRDITAAPLVIGARAVTNLPAYAGTNIAFTWNTATNGTFKLGDHILQAGIAPVPGETEILNNTNQVTIIVASGMTTNALIDKRSVWKVMDKGLDLSGAPWQTSDYTDGFWTSGSAPLGYGLADIATPLGYGGVSSNRYVTTYFRREFTMDFAPLSITGRVMRTHGVILYLNGTEIARQNMPAGDVTSTTLASGTVTGTKATNYFGFAIPPGALMPGRNLLTAELHLASATNTTAGFALELTSVNPTVPLAPSVAAVSVEAEGSVQSGDNLGVLIELVNNGNAATACLVLLRDAATGATLTSQTVNTLLPGEGTVVRLTWPTFGATAGARTLQAVTVINGVTNLAAAATAPVALEALDFAPRKVAATGSIGGRCNAVAVSGRYVYLGCGATLEVWDAAVPAAPIRVGAVRLPGIIENLVTADNWVYAASGAAGVQIVDASSPTQLLHRATFDTSGFARRVTLAGNLLCVADGLGGVRVLNVASPAAPVLAGAYQTTGPAQAVTFAAPRLLVLDGQRGLQSLSAADPAAMTATGALSRITAGLALTAVSDAALVADANGGLYRINLAAPAAPVIATNTLLPAAARGLATSGAALYVAAGQQGLLTLNATTLALQATTAVGGEASDVAVAGNTLYVAAGFAGCRSLDITSPLAPQPLGTFAAGARPVDAAAVGSTLFVAADEGGFQVHSLENLALPGLLATVSSVSNSRCVEVAYPLAYVGDGLNGLKIFNIADPAAPALVGSYAAAGLSHIRRIALAGSRAVITDGRVLQLLSVADPAAPALLATATNAPGSFVFDVAAVNNQAYAACGNAGLRIYGLDNRLALDNTYATPGPATGVASASNLLHVACGPYGWLTLSIAVNPVSPALVKTSPAGMAFGVAAAGPRVFLTDGARVGRALSVAAPQYPLAVTNFPNLTQALRVRAASGLLFVAEDEAGLAILYPKWASVTPAGQSATAGAAFEMPLPEAFAHAARVTVNGLPRGLRYNTLTRMITGVPSQAGAYTVVFSATGMPTQTVKLTVGALPAWAWGTFNGFMEGGGSASMRVTALGKVTGKLAFGSTNCTFSATSYATGGSAEDGFSVVVGARFGMTVLPLALRVSHPAGSDPQTLSVATGWLDDKLPLTLYRDVWKEAVTRLAPHIGYYTATLPGNAGHGSGYLTFTVDQSGQVKVAGRLGDGTSVSLSGALLLNADGRVFTAVYTRPTAYKGGCLFGVAEFISPANGPAYLTLPGDIPFQWQNRSPLATRVYGEGFDRTLGLTGGWYGKLGNLYDYYRGKDLTVGTDEAAPAPEITVSTRRYASINWNPNGIMLTPVLNASGIMTGLSSLPSPQLGTSSDEEDDDNEVKPIDLLIALTRATGVFKGSFKAWFDYAETQNYKRVTYQGVLTPERKDKDDGVAGRGFFLWPDKGQYTSALNRVVPYSFNASADLKILLSE